MLFNKLTIQRVKDETFTELSQDFSAQFVLQKNGKHGITIIKENKKDRFSFTYDFYTNMGVIGTDELWNVNQDVMSFFHAYVQKIVEKLTHYQVQCWVSSRSSYFFPEQIKKQMNNVMGKDQLAIGEKATNLLHLLAELDIPYEDGYDYLYIKHNPYYEADLAIKWVIPKGKIQLIYQAGESHDENHDYAYVMYEIQQKEDYERLLQDIENQKHQKVQLQKELESFVNEQDPSVQLEKGVYYLDDEGACIIYDYGIHADRLCYEVSGFYGTFTTDHYEEILPYLKENFHLYQQIQQAKKSMMDHVKKEDEYAFFFPVDELEKIHEPETFYCSVTDAKFDVYVRYEDDVYTLTIYDRGWDSYRDEKTEVMSVTADTVGELLEAFRSFYHKQTNAKRMELLFDPHYKKHYRKLFYMLNSGERTGLNPLVKTKLTMEEINRELDIYFATHPLKIEKGPLIIGNLLITKEDLGIVIKWNVDKESTPA